MSTMSKLFDTHLHLDLFENKEDLIKEIEENKIYTIAVTNLPILFTKLNNELSSKYIWPALGFHPELLFEYQHHIPQMWENMSKTRYIGEVGLDFNKGSHYKDLQVKFFIELIKRCNKYGNKILTVHSRGSADEVVSVIGNNFKGKAILHWYSGSKNTLKKAIENGLFFSINYSMVKSKSGKELIKIIPLERLLLETDAPFVKFDNQPFAMMKINDIVNELAHVLDIDQFDIRTILWNNFKTLIS